MNEHKFVKENILRLVNRNDLNISGAMTVLYDAIKELNQSIRTRDINLLVVSKLFNTTNTIITVE